ncbi:uncharacterized protein J4E84_006921 [Alternaria hordeiaustralica]|uniref:uncharacterized protein n=1 Tax=Alternaria hordeiaustralica TaxID=1187925 RepID=UPI0020C5B19F|nr:uncharacterized protein J4E84_006921 [Alternaria hordeiaustralica]KAI4683019.1 hypothetical protein J4E84_006921 [Alternaria hordeiaustralica]
MSTQGVPVETPFPDMNIDKQHGPVHVHSATATITRIAKSPPSEGFTTKVIKVVMTCTGNLDTDTILIEDPDILRMFVEKEGKIVISFTQLPMMIPIWKLEPAGPMPDNQGQEDTDEDFEMIRNAWKTCRLVWGRHAGLEELNRRAAVTMRAMQKQDELAARAGNEDVEGHWSDAEEEVGGQTAGASASTGAHKPGSKDLGALVRRRQAEIEAAQAMRAGLSNLLDAPRLEDEEAEDAELPGPSGIDDEGDAEGQVANRSEEEPEDDSEDFEDSSEEADDDKEDGNFGESLPVKGKRSQGTLKKVSRPSQKQLGKRPAKPTPVEANTQPPKSKLRKTGVPIWPTTIITTGTAGPSLRQVMEEMGQILTTDAERQEYMHLVWTRRRAAEEDKDVTAEQAVLADLETFVRNHGIVDLHNRWARWMESGVKTAMPMYKPAGTGVMDAEERKTMFERKKRVRRG